MSFTPLTKRSDFLTIRNQGTSAVAKGLILQTLERSSCPDLATSSARVGIVVSKKLGGAVSRNRIKRRIRALCCKTLVTHGKSSHDYVIIARTAALDRSFELLDKDLKFTLHTTNTFTLV